MKFRCPNCHEALNIESLTCINHHQFQCEDGIFILLEDQFSRKLNVFLRRFEKVRQSRWSGFLQPADYPCLPYGKAVENIMEWKLRQFDLQNIMPILQKRPPGKALELGAYNGWLTHHIARLGYDITAADYFIDDIDGLRNKKYYPENWRSIQMDIRDLSIIDCKFDVVILNRCLQFFENPLEYFISLKSKLASNGLIIFSGMQLYKDPRAKIKLMEKERLDFIRNNKFDFQFVPFKGYLDFKDKEALIAQNVRLYRYPQLIINNLKSLLRAALPRHYYGIYVT